MLVISAVFSALVAVEATIGCKAAEGNGIKFSYDKSPANGTYPEGTNVSAICLDGQPRLRYGASEATCINGTWTPPLGLCQRCKERTIYKGKYYYNQDPINGTYPQGTRASGICFDGLPMKEGVRRATCINGTWTPPLGRCQWRCSLTQLKKDGHYEYAEPEPKKDPQTDWRLGGTKAWAYYVPSITAGGIFKAYWDHWQCCDGKWKKIKDEDNTPC